MQLLETKTQLEIAAESAVSQSVISALVRRAQLPSRDVSWKLEAIGIKAAWWAEKARRAA